MIIIKDLNELNIDKKTAIALGKFDGIHIGHKKLIESIVALKNKGFLSLVFTFDIQAASFFGGKEIKEITTIAEKRVIFENMGVDILVEFPLNEKTAATMPEEFIKDILIKKLNMGYIIASYDISFGYKGMGNAALLERFSKEYEYEVNIIDKVMYLDKEISSTLIREKIEEGNMEAVSKLLGHPYSFASRVSTGQRLGHKLGMPTMNQYPDEAKILPPFGVYYSNVIYEGLVYPGITNIGIRPTVSDNMKVSVETYLYDFDKDMYGVMIETELLSYKRKEMKFGSKEELVKQMSIDLADGRAYHKLKG